MEGGHCILIPSQDKAGMHACIWKGEGFSGFPVQVLFQDIGSPFLIYFRNSLSFLSKRSSTDFWLFCLFWHFSMALQLFQLYGPS